jgi:hypothetical protein
VSDLAKWNIHGPVHTLRTEFAEWDLTLERWQAVQHFTLNQFHPDGKIGESEFHNPGGSISRSSHTYDAKGRWQGTRFQMNDDPPGRMICSYDEHGRLTRVVSVDRDETERESEAYHYDQDGKKTKVYSIPELEPKTGFMYGIEGTAQLYGADGATTITTRYDEGGRPLELAFRDANQLVLRRVVFTRDSTGLLMKEEMHLCEGIPFPRMESEFENAPPGAREAAAATFANLFGPDAVMSSTTYTYDREGRQQERRTRMGELSDQRTTFRYDTYGNPIEQTNEYHFHEMQIDEEGNLLPANEGSHAQDVRFEYTYDARGNWTERVVWSRLHPNPNFQRSNVERREITYYES